jgi:hypothetical protein
MHATVRSRLFALGALAVLGLGLAGAGTAFGLTEPLSQMGSPAEFVVADGNVTLSADGESTTLVENVSDVRAVTIEETGDGQFTVRTREERPLTVAERERARSVALANETLRQKLDAMPAYELSVDPIQKLNATAVDQISLDSADSGDGSGEFTVESTGDSGDGSVTIVRDPTYVEGRAVVRVRRPDMTHPADLKYTADVNLTSGTVTDITDWDAIRREPESTGESRELNGTTITVDGS